MMDASTLEPIKGKTQMDQQETKSSSASIFNPQLRDYGRRVLTMTLLGSAFGAIVGIVMAPPGLVGLAAGGIAGLVVLTPLGLFLGLIGGRWPETFWCGLIGLGLGPLWRRAVATPHRWDSCAAMGLISGAIVGATFVSFFYRLPRLVFGLIRSRG